MAESTHDKGGNHLPPSGHVEEETKDVYMCPICLHSVVEPMKLIDREDPYCRACVASCMDGIAPLEDLRASLLDLSEAFGRLGGELDPPPWTHPILRIVDSLRARRASVEAVAGGHRLNQQTGSTRVLTVGQPVHREGTSLPPQAVRHHENKHHSPFFHAFPNAAGPRHSECITASALHMPRYVYGDGVQAQLEAANSAAAPQDTPSSIAQSPHHDPTIGVHDRFFPPQPAETSVDSDGVSVYAVSAIVSTAAPPFPAAPTRRQEQEMFWAAVRRFGTSVVADDASDFMSCHSAPIEYNWFRFLEKAANERDNYAFDYAQVAGVGGWQIELIFSVLHVTGPPLIKIRTCPMARPAVLQAAFELVGDLRSAGVTLSAARPRH
eukprot:GDKH01020313.1.p1 GENE.GDKH01020313.1~~GDKH01020313.1.p1  ORF type:complete len:381 (-),score=39.36 GDKH01020313.1:313-1455(-)